MKKVAFILVCLLISVSFYSKEKVKISIIQKGSKDGAHYDYVGETHDGNNHTLKCLRPGTIKCGWSTPFRVVGSSGKEYNSNEMYDLVINKVREYFSANERKNMNEKFYFDGILVHIVAKIDKDNELDLKADIVSFEID